MKKVNVNTACKRLLRAFCSVGEKWEDVAKSVDNTLKAIGKEKTKEYMTPIAYSYDENTDIFRMYLSPVSSFFNKEKKTNGYISVVSRDGEPARMDVANYSKANFSDLIKLLREDYLIQISTTRWATLEKIHKDAVYRNKEIQRKERSNEHATLYK